MARKMRGECVFSRVYSCLDCSLYANLSAREGMYCKEL